MPAADAEPRDAVAARILDEAAEVAAGRAPEAAPAAVGRIAIIGDLDGEIALGAAARFPGAELRIWSDALDRERAALAALADAGLAATAPGLGQRLVGGCELVLLRLPKSHDELRAVARLAAAHAAPGAVLVAGEREKHLHRSQSEVLGEAFGAVRGSLGRRKARAVVASQPRPAAELGDPAPVRAAVLDEPEIPGGPLEVRAIAGAFAGARLDIGTRALLAALAAHADAPELRRAPGAVVLDLGCGTGILAAAAARRWPEARVLGVDRSWAAVESAWATAAANGLEDRIGIRRDVSADSLEPASVDVVLCNPPFHDGFRVDEDLAGPIFAGAARVLRPGGAMAAVFNSPLPHRGALGRLVGPTRQLARDAKFTVTLTTRR